MKFDVFLPSLLVSPDWFADSSPPRLPAIETLLAHASLHAAGEWPGPLLTAFNAADAIAAFSAHGDALDTGDRGWMFAEPAHFQADRDTINLFPAAHLDISVEEATQLIDALNANFSDRDLKFSRGVSGSWYVSCDAAALPQTTSIRSALRGAVFEKLPLSRGKLSWKSIQNEAQMLFHSHAINDAREVAGKLTVNGLWFWGEGVLPTAPSGSSAGVDAAFGESALINGLAKWRGSQLASLTTLDLSDIASLAARNLLGIDSLSALHERGDIDGWRKASLKLDTEIFAPLLALLRTGTVGEITLTLPRDRDSLVVVVNAESLRGVSGWWKNLTQKPRPFLEAAHA